MTENHHPNQGPGTDHNQIPSQHPTDGPDQGLGRPLEQNPVQPISGSPTTGAAEPKRRVPLVPAILAGSALFIVGGLAGGAVGASAVMVADSSGTSQGQGGQNGPGGMGGQTGNGTQPGGQSDDGQPGGQSDGAGVPGGQSNGGAPNGQSNGVPGVQNGTSSAGAIGNAGVTHFDQIFTGFAVLGRED